MLRFIEVIEILIFVANIALMIFCDILCSSNAIFSFFLYFKPVKVIVPCFSTYNLMLILSMFYLIWHKKFKFYYIFCHSSMIVRAGLVIGRTRHFSWGPTQFGANSGKTCVIAALFLCDILQML